MQSRWVVHIVGGLVASCLGCKSKEAPPATAAPGSGSAAEARSALFKAHGSPATVEGKPLAIERALVKQLPDGRSQLYLGGNGTCEQLMTNLFDSKDPHVLVDIDRVLLADGGESTGISDVYAGPPATVDKTSSKATIQGELTKGAKVSIEARVKATEPRVELDGTVTAEVCGDVDMPPPATAGAAIMTIAGKPFVIRAALKRGDDIELVDLPRDCTSAKYIGMRLQRERGTWKLDGKRMPLPLSGPAPRLEVTLAPTKEHPGPGREMMALSGHDKIAAYDVELAGTVEMIDCNYTPLAK